VQAGESLQEALRRELREELHLEVDVGHEIGRVSFTTGTQDFVLVGLESKAEPTDVTLTVHSAFRWATGSELREFDFASADLPFLPKLRHSQTGKLGFSNPPSK